MAKTVLSRMDRTIGAALMLDDDWGWTTKEHRDEIRNRYVSGTLTDSDRKTVAEMLEHAAWQIVNV